MKPVFMCYPKCTTCRKAKKFLEAHEIDFTERHIVEDNPSAQEILKLMDRYDGPPRRFFNTSGMVYRERGLKDQVPNMTKEEMAEELATDGMLVKRPQLHLKDKVLVGFKQEECEKALGIEG